MDLRQERHVGACVKCLDRGAHSCAAGADDEHVVRGFHVSQAIECPMACASLNAPV
jgi:hypothetical protein